MNKKKEGCNHAIGTDSCHDILYKMHEISIITFSIEIFNFCPWCGIPIDKDDVTDRIRINLENLKTL